MQKQSVPEESGIQKSAIVLEHTETPLKVYIELKKYPDKMLRDAYPEHRVDNREGF